MRSSVVGLSLVLACSPGAEPAAAADAGKSEASTAASPLDQVGPGSTVLWVGAHPDDESVVAPVLAEICLHRKAMCHFLVLTRGEGGACGLATRCPPDLGTFRSHEMVTAAAAYHAELTQWDWGNAAANTPDDSLATWVAKSGGADKLLQIMVDELRLVKPTFVVTFDPRHGSTCHPDHRAAAQVLVVAAQMVHVEYIFFAESKAVGPSGTLTDDPSLQSTPWIGYAPYVPADPAVWTFDGSRSLATDLPRTGWSYLLDTLAAHASQFTDIQRQKFAAAPGASQGASLLSLAKATAGDTRYDCPLH